MFVTGSSTGTTHSLVASKAGSLTCVANGGPAPTITWALNGVEITTGIGTSNVYTTTDTSTLTQTTSVLSITNPTTATAGTITCTATNQIGNETYSITVTVIDKC